MYNFLRYFWEIEIATLQFSGYLEYVEQFIFTILGTKHGKSPVLRGKSWNIIYQSSVHHFSISMKLIETDYGKIVLITVSSYVSVSSTSHGFAAAGESPPKPSDILVQSAHYEFFGDVTLMNTRKLIM